jgi:hypothetical protein
MAQKCSFRHNIIHNSPTLVPIHSQMNPFHTLTSYFLQIHFDIILRSIPRSPFLTLPEYDSTVHSLNETSHREGVKHY